MTGAPAYFDTSVLLKRYVEEAGSAQARALLGRHPVVSSVIAGVEAAAAIARRRADGDLASAETARVFARLSEDRAHWRLVAVGPLVLDRAEDLVRNAVLRSLDAIHIASALTVQGASGERVPFVTADRRQREAASRAGLEVVWVGS